MKQLRIKEIEKMEKRDILIDFLYRLGFGLIALNSIYLIIYYVIMALG